ARNGMEFYTADALGSALMLTDSAGALATRYTYAPFGRTAAEGVSSGNPFQYTGRENDGLAGLYYYRARYYYPGLGRFISEDPFQLAAGNLYAYVENSPLRFRDPFGLEKCSETSGTVLRDPLKYLGRFPDYVTLSIFPRQLRRFGFSISIDQRGNVFVGGGASFERNYSLMAGWVARSDYRERSVEDLLTGVTVTGTIARRGLGGGVSASSSCAAVELGVSSGSGVSATYGKKTVNILDWLGL
ncbi:MAG TPA: RHS repeat-associated core domain-containing protein, partial [Candidatus Limnocylindrales bacterium]|nr:RHS repeat-associated core domain-containing protein [Candidatus Limnocylindrales bacterium]